MALFSIWEGPEIGIQLWLGAGPPVFRDGTVEDPRARKVLEFQAQSWNEACQVQYDHYGWGHCKVPLALKCGGFPAGLPGVRIPDQCPPVLRPPYSRPKPADESVGCVRSASRRVRRLVLNSCPRFGGVSSADTAD